MAATKTAIRSQLHKVKPIALLRQHRDAILKLAEAHGATDVRVFGSVIKHSTETPNDIDFLIQLQPGRSLFDRIALIQELGELLGMPVDVVTEKSLHPAIRDEVIKSARRLLTPIQSIFSIYLIASRESRHIREQDEPHSSMTR